MTAHDETEREPLLLNRGPVIQPAQDEEDDRTTWQRLIILLPCMALISCFMIGGIMVDIPMSELSEAIICRNIYGVISDPASDPRCKSSAVQSELALIIGWEVTFGFLPSLLLGIPFGLAADKYGRRVILLLACIGGTLYTLNSVIVCRYAETFAPRWRWFGSVFLLIGGGVSTLQSMIYTIIADATTQAQRSTAFLYIATLLTGCSLVASPLTYLAIHLGGTWFAVYLGFTLVALSIPLSALLPETRCAAAVRRAQVYQAAERESTANKDSSSWALRPILHSARQKLALIKHTVFASNPTVGILILSTLFFTLGKSVFMMLLQYVTKRFGWTWAEAGLLISVKNAASMGLTAVVLPGLSQVLLKIGMSPVIKDWWIVRMSAVINITGTLAMGLAPTIKLFIGAMIFNECGGGLQAALRSVVTELVDQANIALVMTVLSISLTVSEMVAGPLMAETFKLGIRLGGVWVGSCYIVSAAIMSVGTIILLTVRVGHHSKTAQAL
ncbi:hypothetical protein NLG97_g6395 [Lecanicillium saksenae]|uniref:Uncharacterized protein n=1 Tax=Lecanicillium saksenae TaxID=468837 RepID=A0ACC1QRF5_9HYPO|nr:hypothetical protein NLG97_g6395 [Lecanicillium saksenae]